MFDKMVALKKELSALLKSQRSDKGKISYLPLLIKAASLSLKQYPSLNATVNKEATEMIFHHNHNIGIAMDTPKGLIVPVIERVQDKSIFEIAADLAQLQADAMSGNISEKQLRGGTFSLSNIGMFKMLNSYNSRGYHPLHDYPTIIPPSLIHPLLVNYVQALSEEPMLCQC